MWREKKQGCPHSDQAGSLYARNSQKIVRVLLPWRGESGLSASLEAMLAACNLSRSRVLRGPCPPDFCGGPRPSDLGPILPTTRQDSGPSPNDVRLVRVPRKRWPKGSQRPIYNVQANYPRIVSTERAPDYAPVHDQEDFVPMAHIPQVEETYAYWDLDYGLQNEFGLSIGETTCTAMTIGWGVAPDKPYGYNRIGIEELSKIALERCATARCAAQTMGRAWYALAGVVGRSGLGRQGILGVSSRGPRMFEPFVGRFKRCWRVPFEP